jgi:hypothetical protein
VACLSSSSASSLAVRDRRATRRAVISSGIHFGGAAVSSRRRHIEMAGYGRRQTALLITPADGEPITFAGLWNEWKDKATGEILHNDHYAAERFCCLSPRPHARNPCAQQLCKRHPSKSHLPVRILHAQPASAVSVAFFREHWKAGHWRKKSLEEFRFVLPPPYGDVHYRQRCLY